MEHPTIDFSSYHHNLSAVSTYNIKGKVTELTGLVVRAVVPGVRIGEVPGEPLALNPPSGPGDGAGPLRLGRASRHLAEALQDPQGLAV